MILYIKHYSTLYIVFSKQNFLNKAKTVTYINVYKVLQIAIDMRN